MPESAALTLLGSGHTAYPRAYAPDILEAFPNRHPDTDYFVSIVCPEFTSVCPITGQPDFAEIRIRYMPAARLVESKSLKLYLFSFRNHGDFHENCVNVIAKDLIALLDPNYLEVHGIFTPRGGIAICPWVNYGRAGSRFAHMAQQRLYAHESATGV